jgi:hypothetical protein
MNEMNGRRKGPLRFQIVQSPAQWDHKLSKPNFINEYPVKLHNLCMHMHLQIRSQRERPLNFLEFGRCSIISELVPEMERYGRKRLDAAWHGSANESFLSSSNRLEWKWRNEHLRESDVPKKATYCPEGVL